MGTIALNKVRYPLSLSVDVVNEKGESSKQTLTMDLVITVDDNGNCSITTDTPGAQASGSGKWTYHGAKKAWGDKDRDLFEPVSYTHLDEYQWNPLYSDGGRQTLVQ